MIISCFSFSLLLKYSHMMFIDPDNMGRSFVKIFSVEFVAMAIIIALILFL